jgi:hypothetical protein
VWAWTVGCRVMALACRQRFCAAATHQDAQHEAPVGLDCRLPGMALVAMMFGRHVVPVIARGTTKVRLR